MKEWDKNSLAAFLQKKETGLLYFYTPLCGTCQLASKMLQVVEELEDIQIGKMNLNFHPELAVDFSVESVPCLVFLHNGTVKETIYALHSVPYLLERVRTHLT